MDAERSTRRVLTMERLDGNRVSDTARLREAGLDLDLIARRGAEMYMEMILGHGYYHADPHPGNLLVLPGGAIGLPVSYTHLDVYKRQGYRPARRRARARRR